MRLATYASCIFIFMAGKAFATNCTETISGARPNIVFARNTEIRYRGRVLSENYFHGLLRRNEPEIVDIDNKRAWTVVFERDSNKADQGYVFEGRREGSNFIVDHTYVSRYEDEIDYFRAVAERKNIGQQVFKMNGRAWRECRGLWVRGSTQVKLWLKHQLRIEDVMQILDGAKFIRAFDRGRQEFQGVLESGRTVRALIDMQANCSHTLVTAFEAR